VQGPRRRRTRSNVQGLGLVSRTIINIGTHEAVIKTRATALERAGYVVRNAMNVKELEKYLAANDCDVLLVGHSLTAAEKRRAVVTTKQWDEHCPVIELYVHSPDLPEADYHVPFDDGLETLIRTVEQMQK
jgi:CheY-like chemotaxis protein